MVHMKTTETVNTKILLKSSFWYVVSNFLTRGLVFITTPIFTRLMTTKQYGDFSVFASWQSIFLVICGLEIYATLNRARFEDVYKRQVDGLGNVQVLFYNNLTGTWTVIQPTRIDTASKMLYFNIPNSGTVSVIYKR